MVMLPGYSFSATLSGMYWECLHLGLADLSEKRPPSYAIRSVCQTGSYQFKPVGLGKLDVGIRMGRKFGTSPEPFAVPF